jgi:hypothetical protein
MADTADIETISQDMDYKQHDATWRGVTNMVKWAIIEIVFLVLALFCFIQAGQVLVGWALIAIGLLLIPGSILFGPKR